MAVPRDVEPEVGKLPQVYLYNIDDLQKIVENNQLCRQQAAEGAKQLIAWQVESLMQDLQVLSVSDLVKRFRTQVEDVLAREQKNALQRLQSGEPAEQVLNEFSRLVGNKILHRPTVLLKKAAQEDHASALHLFKLLLNAEG